VTCLEMLEQVPLRVERDAAPAATPRAAAEAAWYRELFAHVGVDWLCSRDSPCQSQNSRRSSAPEVEIYTLEQAGRDEGCSSWIFARGECELAFYGSAARCSAREQVGG